MKKILITFLLASLLLPSCTKRNAKCRADARKAKKNNIGWKY